jgi:PAS domain S-box-containing protein
MLIATYDPWLVVLSILIAIFASYTALDLGDRAHISWGRITAAAITLGGGIWSMHFVAMLAFQMPIPVSYDITLTVLSLLLAIVVTAIGFTVVSRTERYRYLVVSGIVMGTGIVIMHYTGMAAMRMTATIRYDPWLVAASVVIAISAATAALWLYQQRSNVIQRLLAASVMGVAIAGMHFTGMAAASFIMAAPEKTGEIERSMLAVWIAIAAIAQIGITLGVSIFNRRLADEARYRAVIDTATDGIITIDEMGIIQAFNPGAERIFGYTDDEAIGQNVKALMPSPYHEEHDSYLANYRDTGVRKIIGIGREVTGRRKNGDMFPLDLSVVEWEDHGQRFFTGITRDNSARAAIQQQLMQAQKMEAVGQLAGGMAHDFNNILGVVIGNLDMLAERFPQREQPVDLVEATSAAITGADLVHRLLAFSRRQPLQFGLVNLADAVSNLVPLLRRTIGIQTQIVTRVDDVVMPVMADIAQFENALLNLVLNARDAMPDGGTITIEVRHQSFDDEAAHTYEVSAGDYMMVSVNDTGIGIPPENLSRVFEPFFSTKPPGHGSGLGLSMVFGYIRQSGGVVKIYSEVGSGTVVKMFIPISDRRIKSPDETEVETEVKSIPLPCGTERILVVEDFAPAREMAARCLSSLGYTVALANDADEALKMLETATFDLLFTDVVMPGSMNGIALARVVHERLPHVKILFTSGFSMILKEEIAELNAQFLTKPYRKEDIAHVVRRMFNGVA